MKILLVAPQPFFRVRGTPLNIRNLLRALSADGHQVDLICYPFGEDLTLPGLRIFRCARPPWIRDVKVGPSPAKFPLDAAMTLQVMGRLCRQRYQVVHAVEEAVFYAGPLARLRGIPVIYDMDSLISDQLVYSGFLKPGLLLRMIERLERRAIRRACRVLTVCRSLTDAAQRLVPAVVPVQIEDAPMEEEFVPDPAGADALRRRLEIGSRPCVVYTGNLESYQGIPLLLEAMAWLKMRQPAAVAVVVGGEPRHLNELKRQTASLQLETQVRFTGPLPPDHMPACLTLAAVLVSPRIRGTNTALKLYGYMQTGKPIVATRMETHTQVLDEQTAWLAEPEAASLGQAILEALSADPALDPRGARAAARVHDHYRLTHFTRRVQEMYRDLEREISVPR